MHQTTLLGVKIMAQQIRFWWVCSVLLLKDVQSIYVHSRPAYYEPFLASFLIQNLLEQSWTQPILPMLFLRPSQPSRTFFAFAFFFVLAAEAPPTPQSTAVCPGIARVPLCVRIACISFRLHLHLRIGSSKRFFGGHYKAKKNSIQPNSQSWRLWISHDLTSSFTTLWDLTITPFLGARKGCFVNLAPLWSPFGRRLLFGWCRLFRFRGCRGRRTLAWWLALRFHETWLAGKSTINEVWMVENHL